ncbi:MAG: M23 family metallopeptidase [Patescibacteria group bacterium]|jgi:murein DD-endopeptidase MepM/ murein hydrolase activator NlpD
MLFSIKRSRSERYSQLSFEGFRPQGHNKIERSLYLVRAFLIAIFLYLFRKLKQLFRIVIRFFSVLIRFGVWVKSWGIKKLIWSRGKLGRPVATFAVMFVAFMVFMFGEVFNSSRFVNSQELSPDYLSSVSDIIPKKEVAVTTIPEDRKRAQSFEYIVESGDTLSSIGNKFKIAVDAIRYVNGLTDVSFLEVGQKLTIPPISGLIHKVASGDSLQSIADKYDVAPQAVADFNYILDTSELAVGTELVIPGATVPQPVVVPQYIAPLVSIPISGGGFDMCVWPTSVNIISQYFAWYHNGVDIATPWNRGMPPLYACASGTVVRSGWDPWGLGLHVKIDHGNGYQTTYGHMSKIYVGYGDRVSQGQTIGLMGNTGRSTGPHVHFMVTANGIAQNPLNYMR